MIEVQLTQGRVALIDDEDAKLILAHKWHVLCSGTGKSYASRTVRGGGMQSEVLLHRFILNAPPDMQVDHINGDGLDNRRCNLRLATHEQNSHNKQRYECNKAGFKGVFFSKSHKAFCAQIRCRKVKHHLGYFDTAEDAARAYDTAAIALHGDFARTNYPRQGDIVNCNNVG